MGLVKNKFWRYVIYVTAAIVWCVSILTVLWLSMYLTRSNH